MSIWMTRAGAILCCALLAAGCGSVATTAGQPSPVRARQEIRLHLSAEPASLDPALAVDPSAWDLIGNMMEGLVRPDPDGSLIPGMADRWETDGLHFTFHLRATARWSDGQAVTSTDFVRAWLQALDPKNGSDFAFLLYEIEGAEAWNTTDPADPQFERLSAERKEKVAIAAPSPSTLAVTLREPNAEWWRHTAHPLFFPRPDSTRPFGEVTNGPFSLGEWTPGKEISLKRNPLYWDAGSVRLEQATFRVERDPRAALRLFQMGELDHVLLPGEMAAEAAGHGQMTQPSTMGMVFNTRQKPLSNPQVRQAISLALDRERLTAEIGRFSATPSEGWIPPSLSGGWRTEGGAIPTRGNQLQAGQLWTAALQAAGAERMTLRLLHTAESARLARAIQTMLQQNLAGLTIELEPISFEQRLERVRIGQFDMVLQGWIAEHDDPLTLLDLFITDGPGNDARWISQEYDQLILQAHEGQGDRQALLKQAESILLRELPMLPLYHPIRHWLAREEITGILHRPVGARLDLKSALVQPRSRP